MKTVRDENYLIKMEKSIVKINEYMKINEKRKNEKITF